VVVEGLKKPGILFATDLTLSMAQSIEIYGSRCTIELAIRDWKAHFGLADYQCYLATAIHRFVHLACLAFCLYRLIQLDKATLCAQRGFTGQFRPPAARAATLCPRSYSIHQVRGNPELGRWPIRIRGYSADCGLKPPLQLPFGVPYFPFRRKALPLGPYHLDVLGKLRKYR
jgi:hypothetical protein